MLRRKDMVQSADCLINPHSHILYTARLFCGLIEGEDDGG